VIILSKSHKFDLTDEEVFFSSKNVLLHVIVAIIAILFNDFLFTEFKRFFWGIFSDMLLNTIITGLFFGIYPMWLIIARALTDSKTGATTTGIIQGLIQIFLTNFIQIQNRGIIVNSIPIFATGYIGNLFLVSIIYLLICTFLGILVDLCFSYRDRVVRSEAVSRFFVFTGVVSTLSFLVIISVIRLVSKVEQLLYILLRFIPGLISGFVIAGFVSYMICSSLLKIDILPFDHSSVLDSIQSPIKPTYSTPKTSMTSSFDIKPEPMVTVKPEPEPTTVTQPTVISPSIDKLKLFRNAISRSKEIPFNVAIKALGFTDENAFISWLWEIDLPGFEIDFDDKRVRVTGAEKDVVDAIDDLLAKYEKMESERQGKI
jgi:hypothetical protein